MFQIITIVHYLQQKCINVNNESTLQISNFIFQF